MTKQYDTLVFIGRMQPFHNGHKRVLDRALELADQVLVLLGGANLSRSQRNPFTFDERKYIIQRTYNQFNYSPGFRGGEFIEQPLTILPLDDFTYNDNKWIETVQSLVENNRVGGRVGLIGCAKDHSSYYLKLFPTWGNESVEFLDPVNATDIRELYWSYGATRPSWNANTGSHTDSNQIGRLVPEATLSFMQKFEITAEYERLKREREFIEVYQKNVHKYPRIEHTVDAVVVQSGHILLIKRRAEPGRGIWALPGGFINPSERLEDAMIRELKEETKIKVPEAVLRGSIKLSKTYDDPYRSARGRLITQAFLIRLPDQTSLPKVKGSDDADKASWVPLNELNPKRLFEDHYFIINDLLGGV